MECCVCKRNEDIKYMTDIMVNETIFTICDDCEKEVHRRTETILKKSNYTYDEFITELLIYKESFDTKIDSNLIKNLPYIAAGIAVIIICIMRLTGH